MNLNQVVADAGLILIGLLGNALTPISDLLNVGLHLGLKPPFSELTTTFCNNGAANNKARSLNNACTSVMPLKALSANCNVLMVYVAAVIPALPKSNYKTSSLLAPVTSNDGCGSLPQLLAARSAHA
jgi:hypothetical protein